MTTKAGEALLDESGPGSRRFRDLLARERQDMAWLVHVVAVMYDEVSGGRISKPMTYPEEVVRTFEERAREWADEAEAEAAAAERARILDDLWALAHLPTGGHCNHPEQCGHRLTGRDVRDLLAIKGETP